MANFVTEFTSFPEETPTTPVGKSWQVYVDASSYRAGGGVGVYIVTKQGEEYNYAVKLTFKATNNDAGYEALLAGMTVARLLGVDEVEIRAKSQVVVSQVLGQFTLKGKKLKKYLQIV